MGISDALICGMISQPTFPSKVPLLLARPELRTCSAWNFHLSIFARWSFRSTDLITSVPSFSASPLAVGALAPKSGLTAEASVFLLVILARSYMRSSAGSMGKAFSVLFGLLSVVAEVVDSVSYTHGSLTFSRA
jgi:hypothetical protein